MVPNLFNSGVTRESCEGFSKFQGGRPVRAGQLGEKSVRSQRFMHNQLWRDGAIVLRPNLTDSVQFESLFLPKSVFGLVTE